jgi:hypothetical protein
MNKFFAILLTIAAALGAQARTVTNFFTDSAADTALPLIAANTRMDMVDYFDNGMPHVSENILGGSARIVSADSETINFEMTSETQCALTMLTAANDTVLMLVETVHLPQPDSHISFYDKTWKPLKRTVFVEPKLADWLTAAGKAERSDVEIWLPFMLWRAEYANGVLTLTNTLNTYYTAADDLSALNKWILPKLTYRYNGKKFSRVK